MSAPAGLLVLGLGNPLCADDGVGPAAVAELARRYAPPAGARVLDGGTLGLALLPLLEDALDVLLIDAVRCDAPPGSLVRLAGDEVAPAARERLSVHQVGVADLLDAMALRGKAPRQLRLLGLVPQSLELALGRSPAVAAALPLLVECIVEEAGGLGYTFTPLAAGVPPAAAYGSACRSDTEDEDDRWRGVAELAGAADRPERTAEVDGNDRRERTDRARGRAARALGL